MTILSDYLRDHSVGSSRATSREQECANLRRIAKELEEVLRSDELKDSEKYDVVFDTHDNMVKPILKRLNLGFDYCDPDTTYMEDSWAYVYALQELMDPSYEGSTLVQDS